MPLSGHEKAAIFLSAIGEDAAADVLKQLDVKDIGKITMIMTRMKSVARPVVEEVLSEVSQGMSSRVFHVGGEDFVKKALAKGLGEDGASKILEMASKESPLEALRWLDSRTLVNFLATEHPQTIALIVCLLESAQGAEVLSALPDAVKADVAMRIAQTDRIPESAIDELKEVLKGQLDMTKGKGKKVGGAKTIAEILNQCNSSVEQGIIGKIEEQNNALADSIRKLMFVFEDIGKIDDRGIQMILKETSSEDLLLALKTSTEMLKEKIFRNMSQRAVQILKEEMETKGPVKLSDVEKAQQAIVKVARRLEAEGKIVLAGRGGEEMLV